MRRGDRQVRHRPRKGQPALRLRRTHNMSNIVEIKVPDIGDFDAVEVIEILVAAGDKIEAEQSLITVESDKASMEIPASQGGVVKAIKVKLGDKVSQGAEILVVEATGGAPQAAAPAAAAPAPAPAPAPAEAAPKAAAAPAPASAPSSMASVAPERTSPTASFAE